MERVFIHLYQQAAEMGLKYPHYTFIVYGWYAKSWWDPTKDTTFNCTSSRKEMMEVVQYMLAPLIVQFYEESSSAEPLDTGMVQFNVCTVL